MKAVHFLTNQKNEVLKLDGRSCTVMDAAEREREQDKLRMDRNIQVFDHVEFKDEIWSSEQKVKYEQK